MQRVGRACAVCREGIHFEWSAFGCASCAAAFHVACRAADDAGAAYRSRSVGACSRCGGVLEIAARPSKLDEVTQRPGGPRQAAFAAVFVTLAMLGTAFSAALLLAGLVFAFGAAITSLTSAEVAWLDVMGGLACAMAGAGGLGASVFVLRTPWTAMTFTPRELASRSREPVLVRTPSR